MLSLHFEWFYYALNFFPIKLKLYAIYSTNIEKSIIIIKRATSGDNFRLNVESVRKQNSRDSLFLSPKAVWKIIHSELLLYACIYVHSWSWCNLKCLNYGIKQWTIGKRLCSQTSNDSSCSDYVSDCRLLYSLHLRSCLSDNKIGLPYKITLLNGWLVKNDLLIILSPIPAISPWLSLIYKPEINLFAIITITSVNWPLVLTNSAYGCTSNSIMKTTTLFQLTNGF